VSETGCAVHDGQIASSRGQSGKLLYGLQCSATLACSLMAKDPKLRPEAREALNDPWLQQVSKAVAGENPVDQTISHEVTRNLAVFAASTKLQRAFMHLAVDFLDGNEVQKMLTMFNRMTSSQANGQRQQTLTKDQINAILTKGRPEEEAEHIRRTVEVCIPPRSRAENGGGMYPSQQRSAMPQHAVPCLPCSGLLLDMMVMVEALDRSRMTTDVAPRAGKFIELNH
jgi:hypothetical protein